MSRAVCRNCWTWYSKGETACPSCHIALTAASAGSQAFGTDSPTASASTATPPTLPGQPPSPSAEGKGLGLASPSSGISGLSWLLIGGGVLAAIAIVVIGLVLTGLLAIGTLGPVSSSDGVISVKLPKGWAKGSAPTVSGAKPVLAIARVKKSNGAEPHFIVAGSGQFASLSDLEAAWEPFVRSGKFPIAGNLGPVTRTTVAGAPALTVDYQGSKYAGQLLFVDYGSKTYFIEMSSDPSEFGELRGSDFEAILSSWEWH